MERRVRIANSRKLHGRPPRQLCSRNLLAHRKSSNADFVTYSNAAKAEVLGVAGDVLADYGAVSEPVARLMAEGAMEQSRANLAISM